MNDTDRFLRQMSRELFQRWKPSPDELESLGYGTVPILDFFNRLAQKRRNDPKDTPAVAYPMPDMYECGDKITDLWDSLASWSQKQFGSDKIRGPIGALKGLMQETNETLKSLAWDEYADCFLFLLDATRRAGMTLPEFLHQCERKLEINKNRKWVPPEHDEPAHHIPDSVVE